MKEYPLSAIRLVPTKIHGFVDYIVGVILIVLPLCLDMDLMHIPALLFIISGVMAIIYSIFTKYELGVFKLLPMPFHLALNMTSGLILAFAPWIFGFYGEIYLPHLIAGLFEIIAAVMTKTVTSQASQKMGYFN